MLPARSRPVVQVPKKEEVAEMLPPERSGPGTKRFGIVISSDTVMRLDSIVESEPRAGNRNQLIGAFLAFAAELLELRKPLNRQVEEFKAKEEERTGAKLSDAQVLTLLIEKGLKASKK